MKPKHSKSAKEYANETQMFQRIAKIPVTPTEELVNEFADMTKKQPIIPDAELLTMACEFNLGPKPIVNGRYKWWEQFPDDAKRYCIFVRNTGNPDSGKPDRWGIFDGNNCLDKNGEWTYQGLPSNRDDDFYNLCRYSSVHEAISYYRRWKAVFCEWADEKVKDKPDTVIRDDSGYPTEKLKF